MPFLWNNNIWVVTKDELIPAYFPSYDALRMAIKRYEKAEHGIKAVQRGGNGRELLISFDSLDVEVRNAIGDPRKVGHLMENWYKTDAEAVRFYTQYRFEDGSFLSSRHIDEYIINASVLAACVELRKRREFERKSRNKSVKGVMKSLCDDAVRFNEVLQKKHDCRHTLPESERRFKETFKNFTSAATGFNYESLISGKLRTQNARKVTDEVVELLNNMFAGDQRKPTRTEISRRYDAFLGGYLEVINNLTGEVYQPANFKNLSDATIINYLDKWEYRIGAHMKRSGNRQEYIGQYSPAYSFKKPQYAGSIISIDDRQPPFKYSQNNRAWFYMGIDLASEAWVCAVHGKSKEGIIEDFYRQLLRNYTEWGLNLPAEVECEMSLNASFRSSFLMPGAMFDDVKMEANNARGKKIERYFGELRYRYEKDKAGWIARPTARKEDNKAGSEVVPVVPYDQIVRNSLDDINRWNNEPHSVHTAKTRWQVFVEMQHPNLKPTNWRAILPHLGYKTETSCNAGIIRLQGEEFLLGLDGKIGKDEQLINYMCEVEGRNVDIYWLDGNNGEVIKALVYLRGSDVMICEAIAKPVFSRAKIERTAEDERNLVRMANYKNTVDQFGLRVKNSIAEVTLIDNGYFDRRLNTDFVMPGFGNYRKAAAEITETEILPNIDDDMELVPAYRPGPSLRDRF